MSAVEMAKVVAALDRRFSLLIVFLNPAMEPTAMSMVHRCSGRMFIIMALVERSAQVMMYCVVINLIVSFSQSISGLWCRNHGTLSMRG